MVHSFSGFDPSKHHRRSIRLKGYDYSKAGAYFVTICTQDRIRPFGHIVDGVMRLNEAGQMVQSVWNDMPAFYPGVHIDAFVIMPDHVHGIVVLGGATPRGRPDPLCERGDDPVWARGDDPVWERGDDPVWERGDDTGQARGPAPDGPASTGRTLGDVVHRFKSMSTRLYADGVKHAGWPAFPGRLWQRNYHDRIVRNEEALHRIRQYIHDNPAKWARGTKNSWKTKRTK